MSAYIGDVVKNGLVLYLDAANSKSYVSGSSVWRDLSGNNNSGSLNGPTFSSDAKGSIVFDGTDDYVDFNTTNFPTGTNSRTINLFIRFTAFNTTPTWNWAFYYGTAANAQSVIIGVQSNSGKFSYSGYGVSYDVVTNTILSLNTWYNLTVVYNGTALLGYVNGILVNTTNIVLNTVLSSGRLSAFSGNPDNFAGNIAQVSVYNRALSPAEILENYNATKGRFDTPRVINSVQPRLVTNGLVMCLDAGNGKSYVSGSNTWFDLSGNNNSGSLSGPTYSSTNGGSIVFDGTDDQVLVTGSVTTSTATFCVWIRRNGNQTTYKGILFSRGTNTSGMNFSNSNQIGYHWNDASNTYNWNPPLVIPDLAWSMCVVSVSPTFATAYLCQASGISSATNVVNHGSTTLNNIRIANDSGLAGRFFKGNIAQSLIYNRALSASEVLQNYNATKGRFGL